METLAVQPELPDFAAAPEEELWTLAMAELAAGESVAKQAEELTQTAIVRLWTVGKACVAIRERFCDDDQIKWQSAALERFGNYYPIQRCMLLARTVPDAPPLPNSQAYKQLQIAFGKEPEPKHTPRKSDDHRFVNLIAAIDSVFRWWHEGDILERLDADTRADLKANHIKRLLDLADQIYAKI